jgi:hypothetical protein
VAENPLPDIDRAKLALRQAEMEFERARLSEVLVELMHPAGNLLRVHLKDGHFEDTRIADVIVRACSLSVETFVLRGQIELAFDAATKAEDVARLNFPDAEPSARARLTRLREREGRRLLPEAAAGYRNLASEVHGSAWGSPISLACHGRALACTTQLGDWERAEEHATLGTELLPVISSSDRKGVFRRIQAAAAIARARTTGLSLYLKEADERLFESREQVLECELRSIEHEFVLAQLMIGRRDEDGFDYLLSALRRARERTLWRYVGAAAEAGLQ